MPALFAPSIPITIDMEHSVLSSIRYFKERVVATLHAEITN